MAAPVRWVGVSGSLYLPPPERLYVARVLAELPPGVGLVTGGAIGVDAFAARCGQIQGRPVLTVVPADRSRVDPEFETYATIVVAMPEGSTYRMRNIELVKRSSGLLAFPRWPEADGRSRRSGTWMTVRLALDARKPVRTFLLSEAVLPPEGHRLLDVP